MSFRSVTLDFAVSSQLTRDDFAAAAAAGFKTIINNRPEGEEPGQLSEADAPAAAAAAGIGYFSLPFRGPPPPAVVGETADLLEQVQGPVLAYCRSGTRSITAWAMAQALSGAHTADEIIALTAKAGYDLSGARPAF